MPTLTVDTRVGPSRILSLLGAGGIGEAFGVVLVLSVSLLSQDRPTPPIFTTGAELVLVDFVVSDNADRPVKGLSAKDFVVKEDGRKRPIVTFEAFTGDDPPASTAGGIVPDRVVRPALPSHKAATVIFVDDTHLSPPQASQLRPVLKAVLATVGERTGTLMLVAPNSKVSVAGQLPDGAQDMAAAVDRIVGQRFEDRSSFPVADTEAFAIARGDDGTLARVASRFVALNPELTGEQPRLIAHNRGVEVAHDARRRRDVMYRVALLCLDWLANQPGRHTLVLVSGGFARDPEDVGFNEIVTRSLRVNAPIHFLDVRGLQGMGLQGVQYGPGLKPKGDYAPFTWLNDAEGSSRLADDTGGMTVRNTNDIGKGLGRVLDTMQTYYILGYEPPADAKPGFRRINVEVQAKGLHVRARRGYLAGAPARR